MLQIKKMRLPTCAEYDALATAAKENNGIMHWDSIFSWCQDVGQDWASSRAVRGCNSARSCRHGDAATRSVYVGFRPAFEALNPDTLGSDETIVTVGTLYMDNQPVKVSARPVCNGDIPDYLPGAKLELGEALDDPAYQIRAIKAGDVLIADRVLLRNISWYDLNDRNILAMEQPPAEKIPEPEVKKMRLPTCMEWNRLADITNGDDHQMHWSGIYSWCDEILRGWEAIMVARGCKSASFQTNPSPYVRSSSVGLRPAFEVRYPGINAPDGSIVTAGTLFMDGKPVRVPQKPTRDGDIPDYIPGAKLDLRESLDDPGYQIKAIKVGDILIADRVLLKNICLHDPNPSHYCYTRKKVRTWKLPAVKMVDVEVEGRTLEEALSAASQKAGSMGASVVCKTPQEYLAYISQNPSF